jgi:hypothetical protein
LFIDSLDKQQILTAMKAVLMGITSVDVIKHITPFITESLAPPLQKSLGGKKTQTFTTADAHFEIYFLLLELSDSLTRKLYSFDVLKRASRLRPKAPSRKTRSLFAVLSPSNV